MNNSAFDTTKSQKIAQAYQERTEKLERSKSSFSGTWETNMDTFFPLLCPAREADWIPGWKTEILHSDANGYVSDKCIFKTDKSNPAGAGIWMFVGYEKNKYVEVVKFNSDFILNLKIVAKDNGDGTVTGTWNIIASALTKPGNKEVEKMRKMISSEAKILPKVIGHYLKTGKQIKKSSLILGMAGDAIKSHLSS